MSVSDVVNEKTVFLTKQIQSSQIPSFQQVYSAEAAQESGDVLKDVDINIQTGDIDLDNDTEWWQKALAYVGQAGLVMLPGLIGTIRHELKGLGVIKAIDRLESEIEMKNVIGLKEQELRSEINEDLRKLNQAKINYDNNTEFLKTQTDIDTKPIQEKLDNYLLQTQLDFYNKYSPLQYLEGVKSNLKALEKINFKSDIQHQLPEILKGDIRNKDFYLKRIKGVFVDIKNKIQEIFTKILDKIQNIDLSKIKGFVEKLGSQFKGMQESILKTINKIDLLIKNPKQILDWDKIEGFKGFFNEMITKIKNFIPDFLNDQDYVKYDEQTGEIKVKQIEELKNQLREFETFTENQILDYTDRIQDEVNNFEQNQVERVKQLYNDSLKELPKKVLEGTNIYFGTTIEDFKQALKDHPELKADKNILNVQKNYYENLAKEMQNKFNEESKGIIETIRESIQKTFEKVKEDKGQMTQDAQNLIKKALPQDQINIFKSYFDNAKTYWAQEINTMKGELQTQLKNQMKELFGEITKDLSRDFGINNFLEKGELLNNVSNFMKSIAGNEVKELGNEVQNLLKQANQLKTETQHGIWSVASEIVKNKPELKGQLNDLLQGKVKEIGEQLFNVLRESDLGQEFIQLYQKPTDYLQNVLLDQIKEQQINRFNIKPDDFYNIQLPESELYNFDFINATPEEFNKFKKVAIGKGLFDQLINGITDKKIPEAKQLVEFIGNEAKQMEYLENTYKRAQELRQKLKLIKSTNQLQNQKNKYKALEKAEVMPELMPYLKAAGVENKQQLIEKVKETSKNGKMLFEEQLMLYNLMSNDPELWKQYETTKSEMNKFKNEVEDTLGIIINDFLDNAEEILTKTVNGDFSGAVKQVAESVKQGLKEKAYYLLYDEKMPFREMKVIQKYYNDQLYPQTRYNLTINESIFQNTQFFDYIQRVNQEKEKLLFDINKLNQKNYFTYNEIQKILDDLKFQGINEGDIIGNQRQSFRQNLKAVQMQDENGYNLNQQEKEKLITNLQSAINTMTKDVADKQNVYSRILTPQDMQEYIQRYHKGKQLEQGHIPEKYKQIDLSQQKVNNEIEQLEQQKLNQNLTQEQLMEIEGQIEQLKQDENYKYMYQNLFNFYNFDPNINKYQVKETRLPKDPNKVNVNYNEDLQNSLEEQYKNTKEKLMESKPSERIDIVKRYQQDRQNLIKSFTEQRLEKPIIKQLLLSNNNFDMQKYWTDLIDNYIKKDRINQSKDKGKLFKKYSQIKSKTKPTRQQQEDIFLNNLNKVMNGEVNDKSIKEINQIINALYQEKYRLEPKQWIPERDKNQSWEQWAQQNNVRELFNTSIPDAQYPSFNKTFSLVEGSPEKNWLIERFFDYTHNKQKYDYNESLLQNYRNLSIDDKVNLLKDGLPKNFTNDKEYQQFLDWITFDEKKQNSVWKEQGFSKKVLKEIQELREKNKQTQQRLKQ